MNKSFWKKVLAFLTAPVAALLASCGDDVLGGLFRNGPLVCAYGMPANYKSVSGIVYVDENANGKYDTGEEASGVKVSTTMEDINFEGTECTSSDGTFHANFYLGEGNVPFVFSTADESEVQYETETVEVEFDEEHSYRNDLKISLTKKDSEESGE